MHCFRMGLWLVRNPKNALAVFALAYATRKVPLEYIGMVLALGHFVLKYAHDWALANPERPPPVE